MRQEVVEENAIQRDNGRRNEIGPCQGDEQRGHGGAHVPSSENEQIDQITGVGHDRQADADHAQRPEGERVAEVRFAVPIGI